MAETASSEEGGGKGGGGKGGGGGGGDLQFRRKRRSWMFRVSGATNSGVTQADVLALVRHKYSTLRRLVVTPASSAATCAASPAAERRTGADLATSDVVVEVHFSGPQPSASCGAFLRSLLGGESVEAWPIEVPRGRKRNDVISEEEGVYSADPASVDSTLTSPQKPREEHCEDTWPRQQQQERAWPQQQQWPQQPHPQWPPPPLPLPQQQFGTQNTGPFPFAPLPAAHPQQPDARPLGFGAVGNMASGYGETKSFVPSYATYSHGASSTGFGGGGRPLLPMEEVRVEPSRKEVDVEGRPFPWSSTTSGGAPITAAPTDQGECFLVFTGLERTGYDLGSLNVTALFGLDGTDQIATVTSPLQVGADGRVYAQLFYPSLRHISPELHRTPNIQVVQVDVEVEVLSDNGGEFRFRGPHLKLAYFRGDPRTNNAAVEVAPGP